MVPGPGHAHTPGGHAQRTIGEGDTNRISGDHQQYGAQPGRVCHRQRDQSDRERVGWHLRRQSRVGARDTGRKPFNWIHRCRAGGSSRLVNTLTVPTGAIMGPMFAGAEDSTVRWHRSFYFRIGFSFVLFSVCLLVLQGLIFGVARTRSPLRNRSPNTVVAIVATDLGSILSQDASSDLDSYLKTEYAQSQPIYVVLKDGQAVSNRSVP